MSSLKFFLGAALASSAFIASQAHAQLEPEPTQLSTTVQIVNATTNPISEVGSITVTVH